MQQYALLKGPKTKKSNKKKQIHNTNHSITTTTQQETKANDKINKIK